MQTENLAKNKIIQDLIARLYQTLGQNYFDIVDHWVDDESSIGIANPTNKQILVYISCFVQETGYYDVHLELPPSGKSDLPYTDGGKFTSINFEKLLELVRDHLR